LATAARPPPKGDSAIRKLMEVSMDAARLGDRLRAARDRRGLSQQAVADALGLPRTAITNMETGARAVSTLEITKLADLYGQTPTYFLSPNEKEAEDLLVVLHRVLPEIEQAPQTKREVGRILDLYREGAGLRGLLDQTSEQTVPNYASNVSSAGDAIRQGEVVAQEERRRLRLGIAPIVNAAETISEQGVWTAATDLPDGLSGLFVNHPSIGLAILVNASHRPVRRRFSYAHEYAHALFDRGETVTTTSSQNSTQLAEKRANAFAAAFLMPTEGVADHLRQLDKGSPSRHAQTLFDVANDSMMEAEVRTRPGSQAITYQDVASLARRFGVSYEAAAWRLKSLGHIGVGETNALLSLKDTGNRYMRELGFEDLFEAGKISEPPEQELRGQLVRLAVEAFRQEEISRGRLIEIARKLFPDPSLLVQFAEATRAG
jgi:Zn-dependent peptidase ImmA (M78 family)/transcriptional regulator with XRE-family HTH domain